MKKTLILAATIVSAAFTANANTLVDQWTVDGGAWTLARQSATYSADGGYLIADGNSTARLDAEPKATAFDILSYGVGEFAYVSTYPYEFSIVVPTVIDGLQTIQLQITGALGGMGPNPSFTLYGGSLVGGRVVAPGDSENYVISPDGMMGGFPSSLYTITWDVSDLDLSAGFEIDFDLGARAAFGEIVLTQIAVPEPSTYALLAGAFGLAAVVIARRRRA